MLKIRLFVLGVPLLLLLSACKTTTKEPEHINASPAHMVCYERTTSDWALHNCLEALLEESESELDAAFKHAHKEAQSETEEHDKREKTHDIADSNLAFSTYRDAECLRRSTTGATRQIKNDMLMACKIDLTRERIRALQNFK